jgi:hypothetical protein
MHHRQRALKRPARGSIALGLALAASGCATRTPQPAAPPTAAISYDGTYTGTLRAAGSSTSLSPQDCAADPGFSATVTDNKFSFPLSHSALIKATPSLSDLPTPIYNASIAPDGTIRGFSSNNNTTMDGRVVGTRMTGEVYGLLCYYAFTADRN